MPDAKFPFFVQPSMVCPIAIPFGNAFTGMARPKDQLPCVSIVPFPFDRSARIVNTITKNVLLYI